MDIIEAARQVLAEQERDARVRQDTGSGRRMSLYDVRLAEEIYVIPAYAEPHCVIVSGSEELQVMQWGLIPRTAKPGDAQRYDRENLFKNARAETLFEKWPSRPS
ncbi:SOS response-associated peptidase [Alistipes timonensis]|uniref:SOS response-associated peptidase n=1 Tax=Alistipes timonensis TaxID=1465754 RepID=UPI001E5A5D24|nr:SOS response-associated peptidase [Alistipes timonensis]